jgi:hypothetical protein
LPRRIPGGRGRNCLSENRRFRDQKNLRVIWIEIDCLIKILNGTVAKSFVVIGVTASVENHGKLFLRSVNDDLYLMIRSGSRSIAILRHAPLSFSCAVAKALIEKLRATVSRPPHHSMGFPLDTEDSNPSLRTRRRQLSL